MTLVLMIATILAGGTPAAPLELELVAERTLPPPLQRSWDVRWASAVAVYLAAGEPGIVELAVDDPSSAFRSVVPIAEQADWRRKRPARLGASPKFLAAAAYAYHLSWLDRPSNKRSEADDGLAFGLIADLDVFDNRLLVVGERRDAKGAYMADGAMAWLGGIRGAGLELKPAYYSVAGPGVKSFNDCGCLDVSVVRFLADGSFVVVPGVDDGIYLFNEPGQLQRTWWAADLGLDLGCAVTSEEAEKLAVDLDYRAAYRSRRRAVDEVLPLHAGIGLIVRQPSNGKVRWQLVLLAGKELRKFDLPLTASSNYAMLKGDVREGKIVLLEVNLDLKDTTSPRRLIVLKEPTP